MTRLLLVMVMLVLGSAVAKAEDTIAVLLAYNAPQSAPTKSVGSAKVSNNELECLAKAIYFEAGHEKELGKIAVGAVVLNRTNTAGYPDNVCAVVYQKNYKARGCQFTWSCRKHVNIVSNKAWEESVAIARGVLAGNFNDPTKGATSFNNRPFKSKGLKHTVKIGNHYFYQNRKVASIN